MRRTHKTFNLLMFVMISLLLLSIAFVGSVAYYYENKRPHEIVVPLPIYKVAGDNKYPPYTFIGKDGKMQGLDVDILNAIAREQNVIFQFETVPYSAMLNHWEKEGFSVLAGGLTDDDIQDKNIKVSQSYHTSHDCVFARNFDDLHNWRFNTIATLSEDLLIPNLLLHRVVADKKLFVQVETSYMGFMSVLRNQAKTMIGDCMASNYVANEPTLQNEEFISMQMLGKHGLRDAKLIFGVTVHEPVLLTKINRGLQKLHKTGELAKIIKKWDKAKYQYYTL